MNEEELQKVISNSESIENPINKFGYTFKDLMRNAKINKNRKIVLQFKGKKS